MGSRSPSIPETPRGIWSIALVAGDEFSRAAALGSGPSGEGDRLPRAGRRRTQTVEV